MTISQTQLAQALSEPEVPKFWRGYFQEAFREETQQQLLEIFEHLKETTGFSRSDLARKVGRRPEQVTRWLSAPTNLETDTVSDLALGMGYVPKLAFVAAHTLMANYEANHGNAATAFVHTALDAGTGVTIASVSPPTPPTLISTSTATTVTTTTSGTNYRADYYAPDYAPKKTFQLTAVGTV